MRRTLKAPLVPAKPPMQKPLAVEKAIAPMIEKPLQNKEMAIRTPKPEVGKREERPRGMLLKAAFGAVAAGVTVAKLAGGRKQPVMATLQPQMQISGGGIEKPSLRDNGTRNKLYGGAMATVGGLFLA